jgi:hypothetical protein
MCDTGRKRPAKDLRRNYREASLVTLLRLKAPDRADAGGAQQHDASPTKSLNQRDRSPKYRRPRMPPRALLLPFYRSSCNESATIPKLTQTQ